MSFAELENFVGPMKIKDDCHLNGEQQQQRDVHVIIIRLHRDATVVNAALRRAHAACLMNSSKLRLIS